MVPSFPSKTKILKMPPRALLVKSVTPLLSLPVLSHCSHKGLLVPGHCHLRCFAMPPPGSSPSVTSSWPSFYHVLVQLHHNSPRWPYFNLLPDSRHLSPLNTFYNLGIGHGLLFIFPDYMHPMICLCLVYFSRRGIQNTA